MKFHLIYDFKFEKQSNRFDMLVWNSNIISMKSNTDRSCFEKYQIMFWQEIKRLFKHDKPWEILTVNK